MTHTSDPHAAAVAAPAFLVAPTGARYRLTPEVPPPWPGAGWPAWDEAWGRYVLVRYLDSPDAARIAHFTRLLMQLNHPGVLRIVAVCDAHAASHAAAILEWPAGEPLFATLGRGPLSAADYTHLCWQTLGALAVMQEHGIFASRFATDTIVQTPPMPGSPPIYKLIEPSATPPSASIDENPFRGVLHQFGQMSYRALTGHDWPHQGDAGAMIMQMRSDIPGPALGWIAASLHPDVTQRPADARAMLRGMEVALGGYQQAAPAWQVPPQQQEAAIPPWAQPSHSPHPAQTHVEVAQLTSPLTAPMQAATEQAEAPQVEETQKPEEPMPTAAEEPFQAPPPAPAQPVPVPEPAPEAQPVPTSAPVSRPVSSPTRPLVSGHPSGTNSAELNPEPPKKKPLNVAMIVSLLASVVIFVISWPWIWGPLFGSMLKKPYVEESTGTK